MIKSVHFKNFKALKDATLPLSQFTLIVGPNGSGKSTAMQALSMFSKQRSVHFIDIVTADLQQSDDATVEVIIEWALDERALEGTRKKINYSDGGRPLPSQLSVRLKTWWGRKSSGGGPQFINFELDDNLAWEIRGRLENFKIFSFDEQAITESVLMQPGIELAPNGRNLAGVLENLRDSDHERFEALNEELGRWLPEFDRIAFETPTQGQKAFLLRTRIGQHKIKAKDLSQGTIFALAFLTLAYLPNPPSIICFEEPERGIHPRLLREIRDAMYRLCYPEEYGDKRNPVQVIATTHSPYFLDLYKDHPEEIVIAQKDEQGIHFERLSEKPDINEFLQDAPLGEVWYSGILGGVPMKP
jgi:predicted ATPase